MDGLSSETGKNLPSPNEVEEFLGRLKASLGKYGQDSGAAILVREIERLRAHIESADKEHGLLILEIERLRAVIQDEIGWHETERDYWSNSRDKQAPKMVVQLVFRIEHLKRALKDSTTGETKCSHLQENYSSQ